MPTLSFSKIRGAWFCLVMIAASVASAQMVVEGLTVRTLADGPCFDTTNRYVDCENGTVTDSVTELIWLRDSRCLGLLGVDPTTGKADWPTAKRAAAALEDGMCGLTDGSEPGDWRLPTFLDWEVTKAQAVALDCVFGGTGGPPTLTNLPGTGCHIAGPQAFLNLITEDYWSNETSPVTADHAWRASLSSVGSGVEMKSLLGGVWPVRTGR